MMKKKSTSKKGSCISFITGSCKDEASIDLMKISLKKEADRREKLEKLLQKYDEIHGIQRNHVRLIKSNIIELKDVPAVPKIKFLVDPNIYVDNNLSIQTRQFLCMMLNTFYKRYSENTQYEKQASKINEDIKAMLKSISNNEQLLFKVQKTNINSQVQMQGQLLGEKAKLKDLMQKGKDLANEEKRVRVIWSEQKEKYDQKKAQVENLKEMMLDLESKVIGLNQKITQGEEIRQGNQDKLTGEMAYQAKFEEQVNLLKQAVTNEYAREAKLKKKIRDKKLKIDKLKGRINYDNSRHEVDIKILNLHQPRPSTKHTGVSQILQLERTFQRAMSKNVTFLSTM